MCGRERKGEGRISCEEGRKGKLKGRGVVDKDITRMYVIVLAGEGGHDVTM